MLAKKLLVLDVETTGLDPSSDSIVQLASCVVSRRELQAEKTFSTYVRPTSPMSEEAQRVHGLSSAQLETAPSIFEAIAEFDSYAPEDPILCGHNIGFDVAFLKAAYQKSGTKFRFDYHTVDLWSIAFFILGAQRVSLPAYNLTSLCSFYGISRNTKHDALQDVLATAEILKRLFEAVRGESLNLTGQQRLFSHKQ